mmetsp:Transcript_50276/g.118072  ORF Transcript_50276/g.118072 Transcript_50276/m.118072 type:complete len:213 (+) Transcript_50276:172-810(+)
MLAVRGRRRVAVCGMADRSRRDHRTPRLRRAARGIAGSRREDTLCTRGETPRLVSRSATGGMEERMCGTSRQAAHATVALAIPGRLTAAVTTAATPADASWGVVRGIWTAWMVAPTRHIPATALLPGTASSVSFLLFSALVASSSSGPGGSAGGASPGCFALICPWRLKNPYAPAYFLPQSRKGHRWNSTPSLASCLYERRTRGLVSLPRRL